MVGGKQNSLPDDYNDKSGSAVMAIKMYAVAMIILQTMTDVFFKEYLVFMFDGLLDSGDAVKMEMLDFIK